MVCSLTGRRVGRLRNIDFSNSFQRRGIKLLESSTYARLVQNYLNLVLDRMEPIATPHETQQLANY